MIRTVTISSLYKKDPPDTFTIGSENPFLLLYTLSSTPFLLTGTNLSVGGSSGATPTDSERDFVLQVPSGSLFGLNSGDDKFLRQQIGARRRGLPAKISFLKEAGVPLFLKECSRDLSSFQFKSPSKEKRCPPGEHPLGDRRPPRPDLFRVHPLQPQ